MRSLTSRCVLTLTNSSDSNRFIAAPLQQVIAVRHSSMVKFMYTGHLTPPPLAGSSGTVSCGPTRCDIASANFEPACLNLFSRAKPSA